MMQENKSELNEHNKQEYPPMHTAEHILNQTMIRMFGCARSKNSHIERKKSKCDYIIPSEPTDIQIQELEMQVNEIIAQHLDVTCEFMEQKEAALFVDLSKLPSHASDTLRIIRIGNYDVCACIGEHVENTREIGQFKIISYNYENGRLRIRYKLLII